MTGPGCDTGGGGGGAGGAGAVFLARPGTKAGTGSAVLRCRLWNTKTEGCLVQSDWLGSLWTVNSQTQPTSATTHCGTTTLRYSQDLWGFSPAQSLQCWGGQQDPGTPWWQVKPSPRLYIDSRGGDPTPSPPLSPPPTAQLSGFCSL